jgi:hypothetical protein
MASSQSAQPDSTLRLTRDFRPATTAKHGKQVRIFNTEEEGGHEGHGENNDASRVHPDHMPREALQFHFTP